MNITAEQSASISDRSPADIDASLCLALKRMLPLMTSRDIRATVAVRPGLQVVMSGTALTDLLEQVVASAIHGSCASRLLVSAASHGDHVHISVTDDAPGADPGERVANIRALARRIALGGGGLDVDVRPAEGTVTTLRLAACPGGSSRREQDRATPISQTIAAHADCD